jgi:hypothetical protein
MRGMEMQGLDGVSYILQLTPQGAKRMNFDEFEKATDDQLKAEAKRCFDESRRQTPGDLQYKAPLMLEAQFYMQERDRRDSSRVARRDLWLEVSVIGLICAEIVLSIWGIKLSIKQGADEDTMMQKQNGILTNLQQSTSQTTNTLDNLAVLTKAMSDNTLASSKTLLSLRGTTEAMNTGVHDQIALFYDPTITMTFTPEQKRIQFTNTGRSNLTLTSLKINNELKNLGGPQLITGNAGYYVEAASVYNSVSAELPKGKIQIVPVEAEIVSELGKHFIMHCGLLFLWDNDKVAVYSQISSINPKP